MHRNSNSPARSAARVFSTAYGLWSHPALIFTVTGLSTASTTAATISYTLFGSSNHFAPVDFAYRASHVDIDNRRFCIFSNTYFAASTKHLYYHPWLAMLSGYCSARYEACLMGFFIIHEIELCRWSFRKPLNRHQILFTVTEQSSEIPAIK